MPKIFISYRREETAGYAGRLRDRLVQHFGADQVFMDVDTIELGVDFGEVIERAVADVDVFLCVMGPEWATLADEQGRLRLDNPADFVRMEVASAIERDIRVIPVLVRNAAVPPPDQLPPALEALTRRNALQLTDTRFHADVDRLVAGIRKLGDAQAATNETTQDVEIPAAEPPTALLQSAETIGSQRESNWKWRIAVLLIVLLGGGAGYGWHLYTQMQQRVAEKDAEVAEREARRESALQAERAALEEARREAGIAAELAAQREAERAQLERGEAERRAEAERQARREEQVQALERRRAELQAEEESRVRAQEQAEFEAKRQAEKAAALDARHREARTEAERAEAADAARREAALEARRQAELDARTQARRDAEAAQRRSNDALKVRAKRMVEDIARLYASHKTEDNCGVVRRTATTLERYFDTHYPLPDDVVVTVRYPRIIDDPKVSDLAKDRNLRIRGAKSECF